MGRTCLVERNRVDGVAAVGRPDPQFEMFFTDRALVDDFKNTLASWASGVTVVTANDEGMLYGLLQQRRIAAQ